MHQAGDPPLCEKLFQLRPQKAQGTDVRNYFADLKKIATAPFGSAQHRSDQNAYDTTRRMSGIHLS
jgi:hypothetical protein